MLNDIKKAILPYQEQLLNHPLYKSLKTPDDLHAFMQHHVFAVWDFMSLLKALQSSLTKTTTPWYPLGNPEVRYLINEIVLAEETDVALDGRHMSHYEMYIDAMQKAGADTTKMKTFLDHITHGTDIFLVIAVSEIPKSVKQFLKFTFNTISEGKSHKIASAFTFGREDLIPGMFTQIIANIQQNFPDRDLTHFKYYFDRHIELDGDEHGPMALKMVEELCGHDPRKWSEAETAAVTALRHRIELWDGILKEINTEITV
ncbi:MAG: heme oxygenase [Cytophagaceae bacterium]|nr:heme oxygenase [Cytophagaceae bacterium]|tara:strand:- start:15 stop:791 length:777 start_codon:yes stop_codon:yes gene_type:complete